MIDTINSKKTPPQPVSNHVVVKKKPVDFLSNHQNQWFAQPAIKAQTWQQWEQKELRRSVQDLNLEG